VAHKKRIAKASADKDLRAEADARFEAHLARFERDRARQRENMRGTKF